MKRLIILRHSNAEIGEYNNDFNRALTTTGILKAKNTAEEFKQFNISVDLIVSSSAVRTKQTTTIFAETLEVDSAEIKHERFLYDEYTTTDFVEYCNKFDDSCDNVIICGHNPSISRVTHNLSDFPKNCLMPCGVVVLCFDIDSWSSLNARSGKVQTYF